MKEDHSAHSQNTFSAFYSARWKWSILCNFNINASYIYRSVDWLACVQGRGCVPLGCAESKVVNSSSRSTKTHCDIALTHRPPGTWGIAAKNTHIHTMHCQSCAQTALFIRDRRILCKHNYVNTNKLNMLTYILQIWSSSHSLTQAKCEHAHTHGHTNAHNIAICQTQVSPVLWLS